MAKSLYFYADGNQAAASNVFRNRLIQDGLTFTELRLDRDQRKHPVTYGGIEAVIDVDGAMYEEIQTASEAAPHFATAPGSLPPSPLDAINPLITKVQAQNTLKTLLETNPSAWTALQERQAMYLLLLGLFRDLKNGGVY